MNEIPEACRTMADSVSNQAGVLECNVFVCLPPDQARCRLQFWVEPHYAQWRTITLPSTLRPAVQKIEINKIFLKSRDDIPH